MCVAYEWWSTTYLSFLWFSHVQGAAGILKKITPAELLHIYRFTRFTSKFVSPLIWASQLFVYGYMLICLLWSAGEYKYTGWCWSESNAAFQGNLDRNFFHRALEFGLLPCTLRYWSSMLSQKMYWIYSTYVKEVNFGVQRTSIS